MGQCVACVKSTQQKSEFQQEAIEVKRTKSEQITVVQDDNGIKHEIATPLVEVDKGKLEREREEEERR
jgi:hypothetical protein